MTEAEWLDATDPRPMLEFLAGSGKASRRKLRLYAAGYCRQVWSLLHEERSRAAVEVAERYADGLISEGEREAAFHAACEAGLAIRRGSDRWPETVLRLRRSRDPYRLRYADFVAGFAAGSRAGDISTYLRGDSWPDQATCARLLRCIFGNPFHAVPANAVWITPSAAALARDIYDDRTFDRLALLADALEDAGCADAEVLGHLRSKGPHVRGCFGVDLALRKE